MTHHDPLVAAANAVVSALHRLGQEWETAGEAAHERDSSGAANEALQVELAKGYPFGESLDELIADAADWAEHVKQVMANPPGALRGAAQDIRFLAGQVTARASKEKHDPDEYYRLSQTGGLGGEVGDLGAVLGLNVAGPLADLLEAAETGGDINAIAARVAEAIRTARRKR